MTRRLPLLPLLLLIPACTLPPPPPGVELPPAARVGQGITDPVRSAILSSAYVFARPDTVQGDPAAAAEALGNLEFLAADLAVNPTYQDLDGIVVPMLAQGRDEARATFGFRPGAPAQVAMDALYATAAALRAGRAAEARAALTPLAPGQEDAVLRRLEALPALPRAAAATRQAQTALMRRDRGNDGRGVLNF